MSYELHQGKAVPGVWGDAAKGLFTQACAGQSNSENNLFLTPHTRGDQCCFSISAVWLGGFEMGAQNRQWAPRIYWRQGTHGALSLTGLPVPGRANTTLFAGALTNGNDNQWLKHNILICDTHFCYTNAKIPDFYVFHIGFGQIQKHLRKRENYCQAFPISDTCVHFFFAIHLCYTLCEGGFYFVYQVKWNLQFYLVTCSEEVFISVTLF